MDLWSQTSCRWRPRTSLRITLRTPMVLTGIIVMGEMLIFRRPILAGGAGRSRRPTILMIPIPECLQGAHQQNISRRCSSSLIARTLWTMPRSRKPSCLTGPSIPACIGAALTTARPMLIILAARPIPTTPWPLWVGMMITAERIFNDSAGRRCLHRQEQLGDSLGGCRVLLRLLPRLQHRHRKFRVSRGRIDHQLQPCLPVRSVGLDDFGRIRHVNRLVRECL